MKHTACVSFVCSYKDVIAFLTLCLLLMTGGFAVAQQVGTSITADGASPNTNAILDIQSPSTGDGKGLLIPRVTENQRTNASIALAGGLLDDSGDLRGGPAHGLIVYQTDGTEGLYYNTSTTATPSWTSPGSNAGDFMADGSVAMTGDLDMGGQRITNVSTIIEFSSANTAVGQEANGSTSGTALGYQANAATWGSAIGYQADASGSGVAMGREAAGNSGGAALGYMANGASSGTAVGSSANGYNSGVAAGYQAGASSYGAAVGYQANGNNYAAAVGYQANGYSSGAAFGCQANGYNYGAVVGYVANAETRGAAIGYGATGNDYGVALGDQSIGTSHGVAIGATANGSMTNVAVGYLANAQGGNERIAIGHNVTNEVDDSAAMRGNLYLDGATNIMVRSSFGSGGWTALVNTDAGDFKADGSVAMTGDLDMGGQDIINVASNIAFNSDSIIIGKNATADYDFQGVAVGSSAHGDYQGVAVGYQANGTFGGSTLGYQANAYYYGVAVGHQARATNYGVAVGKEANAIFNGAAVGSSARGYIKGAAVGANARANDRGSSIGYYANALEGGIAIGYDANGITTNIAIGFQANVYDSSHINGGDRIAIGRDVTNQVEDSCRIRGNLYLDGATGVLYRSTFGSGAWTALGGGGSAISAFGYTYDLAVGGQVVAGGADVVFSNNGPLLNCTHTAGTTIFTVPSTGTYKVNYSITITAGIGAQMAIAVNGTVDASTSVDLLVATGTISGTAMLSLSAGDVLTLRNNSATPFTTTGSPSVGAQLNVIKMD